jgi:hypothetical protein
VWAAAFLPPLEGSAQPPYDWPPRTSTKSTRWIGQGDEPPERVSAVLWSGWTGNAPIGLPRPGACPRESTAVSVGIRLCRARTAMITSPARRSVAHTGNEHRAQRSAQYSERCGGSAREPMSGAGQPTCGSRRSVEVVCVGVEIDLSIESHSVSLMSMFISGGINLSAYGQTGSTCRIMPP